MWSRQRKSSWPGREGRTKRVILIEAATNRTDNYWQIFVPELKPGQLAGYRVQDASNPASGARFDAAKVLLDPPVSFFAPHQAYSSCQDPLAPVTEFRDMAKM